MHCSARTLAQWMFCIFLLPAISMAQAQDDGGNQEAIQMILELLGDADRDMRAIGLQYVREEAPGEAATRRFVEQLPGLPPESQAELVEALGKRGDSVALPRVLELAGSEHASVRAAAIRAMGGLGSVSEVPLLIRTIATAAESSREAARDSLIQLAGDGVDEAIASALEASEDSPRAPLLRILAARNAASTVPAILACTKDRDPAIRAAAIHALRRLAGKQQVSALISILNYAGDDKERRLAESALLATCSRGGAECVDQIVVGMEAAAPSARVALLRALARSGGKAAMEQIVLRLDDADPSVGDEAARMLAAWPDSAAIEPLLLLFYTETEGRRWSLAVRGLVRLARPQADRQANMEVLSELWKLAQGDAERRLILGALSEIGTMEAWVMAKQSLETPAVFEEACSALTMIAQAMPASQAKVAKPTLELIVRSTRKELTRQRAEKLLETM